MRIIPAIDVIDGKCVRLSKGNYDTKIIYNENPLEVAKEFESHGIRFLHLVDLDGAKLKRIVNYKLLEQMATSTSLHIDFGGGLRSDEDVEIAFRSGARQVTGGSVAIDKPGLFLNWKEKYGPEKIILGADFIHRKIATDAWDSQSEEDITDFIKTFEAKGVQYVIATDISKDGMLQGPSLRVYSEITEQSSVKLIASGGIRSIEDLKTLKAIGCEGAIIGKAIYEGKINLNALKELC